MIVLSPLLWVGLEYVKESCAALQMYAIGVVDRRWMLNYGWGKARGSSRAALGQMTILVAESVKQAA